MIDATVEFKTFRYVDNAIVLCDYVTMTYNKIDLAAVKCCLVQTSFIDYSKIFLYR